MLKLSAELREKQPRNYRNSGPIPNKCARVAGHVQHDYLERQKFRGALVDIGSRRYLPHDRRSRRAHQLKAKQQIDEVPPKTVGRGQPKHFNYPGPV